jgi:putative transposase
MPRRLRYSSAGVPFHVIQRGNDRQYCFLQTTDFVNYLYQLKHYSQEQHVAIHAWVLMSNHVHLLCTPENSGGISKMMQCIGGNYVRQFNQNHQRTGTLWEGRFKSWPVLNAQYLFQLYRYIELNPVRAGIVKHAKDYPWSSYRCNALGLHSDLWTAHPLYQSLSDQLPERLSCYQMLFNLGLTPQNLQQLRSQIYSY